MPFPRWCYADLDGAGVGDESRDELVRLVLEQGSEPGGVFRVPGERVAAVAWGRVLGRFQQVLGQGEERLFRGGVACLEGGPAGRKRHRPRDAAQDLVRQGLPELPPSGLGMVLPVPLARVRQIGCGHDDWAAGLLTGKVACPAVERLLQFVCEDGLISGSCGSQIRRCRCGERFIPRAGEDGQPDSPVGGYRHYCRRREGLAKDTGAGRWAARHPPRYGIRERIPQPRQRQVCQLGDRHPRSVGRPRRRAIPCGNGLLAGTLHRERHVRVRSPAEVRQDLREQARCRLLGGCLE
jgi:hypothetical protein